MDRSLIMKLKNSNRRKPNENNNKAYDEWSAWILQELENICKSKYDKETEIYLLIQRIKQKGKSNARTT